MGPNQARSKKQTLRADGSWYGICVTETAKPAVAGVLEGFDKNGRVVLKANLVSPQESTTNGNTATMMNSSGTYNWDFENRLTSVALPGGGVVTFKCVPLGRRI
jgi:hypothetical protein